MIQKIWNIVLNILITCITVCVFTILVCYIFGFRYYVVLSGSMEPAIHTGSLGIVNTKAKYEDMKQGDIVAYKNAMGTRVTHRVETVVENGLVTKGDANEMNDGLSVNKDNFIGETIGSIPLVGYLLMFLQSKKGMILAIASIIVLWLIDMIIQCLSPEKRKTSDIIDSKGEKV